MLIHLYLFIFYIFICSLQSEANKEDNKREQRLNINKRYTGDNGLGHGGGDGGGGCGGTNCIYGNCGCVCCDAPKPVDPPRKVKPQRTVKNPRPGS
uniref:Uncharacterized protein n=1 Tax=Meloidogyne hapla TaxID=6305 RepID=A0A1I8BXA0_MELHA